MDHSLISRSSVIESSFVKDETDHGSSSVKGFSQKQNVDILRDLENIHPNSGGGPRKRIGNGRANKTAETKSRTEQRWKQDILSAQRFEKKRGPQDNNSGSRDRGSNSSNGSRKHSSSLDRQYEALKFKRQNQNEMLYDEELAPQIMMYKLLSHRQEYVHSTGKIVPCHTVNIPETVVFHDRSGVPGFWLKSKLDRIGDQDVEVLERSEGESQLTRSEIIQSFIGSSHQYHVVAVFKTKSEMHSLSSTRVVRAFEFEQVLDQALALKRPCAIQKYIRPKGIYASKARALFRKGIKNPFCSFVITNKQSFFEAKQSDDLSNYIVDTKNQEITVVKSIQGQQRSTDHTILQMQSFMDYMSQMANIHFEFLVMDFVKEQGANSSSEGKWYMIGIVSYKFDSGRMSTQSLNLYPFTLQERDNTSNWDVLLPLGSSAQLSKEPILALGKEESTQKRCGICLLKYRKDAISRSVPTASIVKVQDFISTLSESFTRPQVPLAANSSNLEVCKDCYLLSKKVSDIERSSNLLQNIVKVQEGPPLQILDEDDNSSCVTRISIYFNSIQDLLEVDQVPLSYLSYELLGESHRVVINPQRQKLQELQVKRLQVHQMTCDISASLTFAKGLRIRFFNEQDQILAILKLDLSPSTFNLFEAQASSMIDDKTVFTLKGCISVDPISILLPEKLITYMNQGRVQPTFNEPSVSDSLMMLNCSDEHSRQLQNLNTLNQNTSQAIISDQNNEVKAVPKPRRPMSGQVFSHKEKMQNAVIASFKYFKHKGTRPDAPQHQRRLVPNQSIYSSSHSKPIFQNVSSEQQPKIHNINGPRLFIVDKKQLQTEKFRPKSASRKLVNRPQFLTGFDPQEPLTSSINEAKPPKAKKSKRRGSIEDDLLNNLLKLKIVEQKYKLHPNIQGLQKFEPQSTFGQKVDPHLNLI